jgi:hypothetical protein
MRLTVAGAAAYGPVSALGKSAMARTGRCLAALGVLIASTVFRAISPIFGQFVTSGPVDNPNAKGPASKQAAMVCYRHTGLINDG